MLDALADTRVVLIAGGRQVGKTTLAEQVVSSEYPMETASLDDEATRRAAIEDPTGFIADRSRPLMIDEIQRAPDLLLAIKRAVDREPVPGSFLITGSSNLLSSSRAKDSLAGRVEIIRLFGLSQAEIRGSDQNFVDALFSSRPPQVSGAPVGRAAFVEEVSAGGFPEARRREPARRRAWFESYLETVLSRDLRDLAEVVKADRLPPMMRLLAAQSGGILSYRAIAQRLQLHHDTIQTYVSLLEQLFLVFRLPAWRRGIGAREIAKPKLHIADSGLMCHLLNADAARVADDDQITGKALETFVVSEVVKHLAWATTKATAYHYQQPREDVDLVLETDDGSIVGVEVKASATVGAGDFRWLAKLREAKRGTFSAGVVVYSGEQTLPFGDRLWAVPISSLWA